MKTILLFLLFTFLACRSTNNTEKSFPISTYSSGQKYPLADPLSHKPGDVEIFRVLGKDTIYYARMYRLEEGSVKPYETVITGHMVYDRVNYQWLNDSTVSFNLLDSKTNKGYTFQLTGYGANTAVQ
jgi:hypothetical protein